MINRQVVLATMSIMLASIACVSNSPLGTEISEVECGKTVVIDNLTDAEIVSITDDEVVLSFSDSFLCINPGDVIVSGGIHCGTYGFLRTVTEQRVLGNTMILSTRNASLTDAIRNCEVETILHFSPGRDAVTVTEVMEGVSGKYMNIDLSEVTLFSGDVGGSYLTVEITSGTIVFDPEIDLGFEIRNSQINEFHAIASGDAFLDCDFLASLTGSVELSRDTTLYSYSQVFVQWVGWVPVVEVATLSFVAGFDLNSTTGSNITTGFDLNTFVTAGAEYENNTWSSVWETGVALNAHPTEWCGCSNIELQGYVMPVVSVAFYGIVGPYIEIVPYLTFEGQAEGKFEYFWQTIGGIEAVLGFDVSILGYSIADYYTTLAAWETVIDEGSGSSN